MTEEEYKNKLDELYLKNELIKEQSYSFSSIEDGWNYYVNHPFVKEFERIDKEYRKIKSYSLSRLDKLGEECLMSFNDFKYACLEGYFDDGDGFGNYATETDESDIEVYPSDITSGIYRNDFTHVCWYNK